MEAAVQGKAAIGNIELLGLLATSPKQAFTALDAHPRIWFPLLLTLVCSIGVIGWYYSIVDIAWLTDHMLSSGAQTAQMSDSEREHAAARMSRAVFLWSSLVGLTLFVLLIRVAEAAYYLLAGN